MEFVIKIIICVIMSLKGLKCDVELDAKTSLEDLVILKSNSTTVVGRKLYTVLENKPFAAFWRIPYGEPPVGDLRFKPPKKHSAWLDNFTYDYCKPYNDTCSNGFTEDCLYLSVYMPLEESNDDFPVLVWIHEHSNLHEPDFFIDENVIVVSVSYRIGILGFLNTGDDFASGNMGAKDVLMALEWVRDNITLFNGDVNKVTLAGSGHGAIIVAASLLSSSADDLFNRVIIQSGSALSPADFRQHDPELLEKLYWRLNGPFNKVNKWRLYNLLEDSNLRDLQNLSEDLYDSTEVRDRQRLINSFTPSIEESKKQSFINKPPIKVYKRGMANNEADVMMGYTTLEALYKLKGFVKSRKLLKYLNYNFQYLLPFEGRSDEYESRRYRKIRRKIMDFYFVNGTIGERSLRRYAKYVSDQVIYPLLRQAQLHAATSCSNVYLYRFAFKGSLNIGWDTVRLNYSDATFGDEICYLFRCKSVNEVYRSVEASNERQFIKKIVRLWANFAKCGNPTPKTNDNILGALRWNPLTTKSLKALNFAKKINMVKLPEEKRVKFWDELRKEFFSEKNDWHDEL